MRFAFGRRPLFTAWVSEFGFALAERVTDENIRHILVGVLKQKSRDTGMTVDELRFKAICSHEFLFNLFF